VEERMGSMRSKSANFFAKGLGSPSLIMRKAATLRLPRGREERRSKLASMTLTGLAKSLPQMTVLPVSDNWTSVSHPKSIWEEVEAPLKEVASNISGMIEIKCRDEGY